MDPCMGNWWIQILRPVGPQLWILVDPGIPKWWILVDHDPGVSTSWILLDQSAGYWWIHMDGPVGS